MFSRPEPSPRLALLVYVVLALVAVGPALRLGAAVGDGVDMYGTLWFYWWIKDCIEHLRDPSFTELFFYPLGKDIFAHTGDNFVDAVFAAPFVAALGVPAFSAPFVAVMLVANAWTFRAFARDQLGPTWAAFGAAALWEVNPFTIFEITCGRYTQAFLPFFALALTWFVRTEKTPGWRAPILLGLFVGLQGWTYWFSGWFLVFMLIPAALYALWLSEDRPRLILRYVVAAAVCLAVIAPAAVAMLRAESSGGVPGLANVESVNLFQPPHQLANNVSKSLHGLIKAERHGSPLLTQRVWTALAVAWLIFGAQRRRWAPGAVVLLIFAIGPVLELPSVRGGVVLPWYMAAYHYLPYFDRLWFPYRMMVGVFFVLCLGAGTLLLRVERARGAKLTALALAVTLV
ncbi:glycosyltransferase family 39 protein, partial [Myxococcota bacterium]|nr:glycosyltransferase family 39 protein [Myxococcota bacterium]